ncbi:hypothetical protein L3X38_024104 [Prunus dulcis]|uniref:Uncharacterized protein n=1 Tax=Prunus dulcis TaxID=3755 RepID=A0AAD4W001_PRUDU|nr:hypothetical protein L3X38_024104 [Prunus dulcis]
MWLPKQWYWKLGRCWPHFAKGYGHCARLAKNQLREVKAVCRCVRVWYDPLTPKIIVFLSSFHQVDVAYAFSNLAKALCVVFLALPEPPRCIPKGVALSLFQGNLQAKVPGNGGLLSVHAQEVGYDNRMLHFCCCSFCFWCSYLLCQCCPATSSNQSSK